MSQLARTIAPSRLDRTPGKSALKRIPFCQMQWHTPISGGWGSLGQPKLHTSLPIISGLSNLRPGDCHEFRVNLRLQSRTLPQKRKQKKILLKHVLLLCMWVQTHIHATMHLWWPRDQGTVLWNSIWGDWTQVTRFYGKHLYALSHLTGPVFAFL